MSRPFADILNEWTSTLIEANRKADDPATIELIMRLGTLGQKLIYEASISGMTQLADSLKRDDAVCNDIDAVVEGLQ